MKKEKCQSNKEMTEVRTFSKIANQISKGSRLKIVVFRDFDGDDLSTSPDDKQKSLTKREDAALGSNERAIRSKGNVKNSVIDNI